MPDTFTTIVTSAITAVAVMPAVAFTVGPRLEARNRKLQEAHRAREECTRQMLTLATACMRLEKSEPEPHMDDDFVRKLEAERDRWRQQVDTATIYMVDQFETFAATYVGVADVSVNLVRYAGTVRMMWLSTRPEKARLREIRELTQDMMTVYSGGFFWNLLRPRVAVAALVGLKDKLAAAEAPREELEA